MFLLNLNVNKDVNADKVCIDFVLFVDVDNKNNDEVVVFDFIIFSRFYNVVVAWSLLDNTDTA